MLRPPLVKQTSGNLPRAFVIISPFGRPCPGFIDFVIESTRLSQTLARFLLGNKDAFTSLSSRIVS